MSQVSEFRGFWVFKGLAQCLNIHIRSMNQFKQKALFETNMKFRVSLTQMLYKRLSLFRWSLDTTQ